MTQHAEPTVPEGTDPPAPPAKPPEIVIVGSEHGSWFDQDQAVHLFDTQHTVEGSLTHRSYYRTRKNNFIRVQTRDGKTYAQRVSAPVLGRVAALLVKSGQLGLNDETAALLIETEL